MKVHSSHLWYFIFYSFLGTAIIVFSVGGFSTPNTVYDTASVVKNNPPVQHGIPKNTSERLDALDALGRKVFVYHYGNDTYYFRCDAILLGEAIKKFSEKHPELELVEYYPDHVRIRSESDIRNDYELLVGYFVGFRYKGKG